MSRRIVVIFLLIGLLPCAKSQPLYPVVNRTTQTVRDNDRHLILDAELQAERDALAKAQTAFAASRTPEREAEVHRRAENIKSLLRELDGGPGNARATRMTVRAVSPAANANAPEPNRAPRFWDPYNRTPDVSDSAITPRRESP